MNIETPAVREYPFDASQLQKGDRVTVEQIEAAYGVTREHKDFWKKQLAARQHVENAFALRDIVVVVRSHHDDLVILLDEDAAAFTNQTFKASLAKMAVSLHKQQHVDRSNLSDPVRTAHDTALNVNGRTLAGARGARRKALAPSPVKRLTPGER